MNEQAIVYLKETRKDNYSRNLNAVKRKRIPLDSMKSDRIEGKHEWLFEVATEMGVPGKTELAYRALKAVMSVLCNKIPDGDLNNEKIKNLL